MSGRDRVSREGAKRRDARGDRRDGEDAARTLTRVTITAGGGVRNLPSGLPGPQRPRQQPRRVRGKEGGRGRKVVTRCVPPGWP